MDAEPLEEKLGKDFTDDCVLYRQIPPNFINLVTNDINPAVFGAKRNEGELSTDWNKLTKPEGTLIRVGVTYKTGKTEYKDASSFHICELNVRKIRALGNVMDILHTPKLNDPEVIGNPNNISHTDVLYVDEELKLKMKGIAVLVTNINRSDVNQEVERIRTENNKYISKSVP